MKLALIGKNISHSRSPEIYKNLLQGNFISCDLLDYENETEIPKAAKLFLKYDGISITTPYKKYFLDQVVLINTPKDIPGFNCMRRNGEKIEATNTDFLAIKSIIRDMKEDLAGKKIKILGDGVMSKVTELVLLELKLDFEIISRRKTDNFSQLSFSDDFVINSCSRDYVFQGKLTKDTIFWDYNYNFLPHQNTLPLRCGRYIDGLSLLELQAKFALQFWQNVTV